MAALKALSKDYAVSRIDEFLYMVEIHFMDKIIIFTIECCEILR